MDYNHIKSLRNNSIRMQRAVYELWGSCHYPLEFNLIIAILHFNFSEISLGIKIAI